MGYGLLRGGAAHGAATTWDRKHNEAGRHRRGDLDGKALARAWMYGPACVAGARVMAASEALFTSTTARPRGSAAS
jgi:hypothetical protein